MFKFWRDLRLIFNRNFVRTYRNPMWLMIGLMQPILYLLFFAPLLDGLRIPGFSQGSSALNGFMPGLLVMSALFGMAFSGSGVLPDLQSGMIERLRVTPASRLALLLGMLLQDVMQFLIQCGVLIAFATLVGLRADLGGVVLLFGLLAVLGMMMAAFSYAIAFIFKNQSTLAALVSALQLPLLLLSGVLLPLTLAPQFMKALAKLDPFAYSVDASRLLINGHTSDSTVALAFVIIAVMCVVTLTWSVRVFRKATA
jgi:ABC-2 type transport system permease protein